MADHRTSAPAPAIAATTAADTSAHRAHPVAASASTREISTAAPAGVLHVTGRLGSVSMPIRRPPIGETTVAPPSQRGTTTAARPAPTPSTLPLPASGNTTPASSSPIVLPLSSTGSRHHTHASETPGSAATARSPSSRSLNGICARSPVHAIGVPRSSTRSSASTARPPSAAPRRSSANGASGAASLPPASSAARNAGRFASVSRRRCTTRSLALAAAARRSGATCDGTRASIASAASAIAATAQRPCVRRGHSAAIPSTTSGARHSSDAAGRSGQGPAATPASTAATAGGIAPAGARRRRNWAAVKNRRPNRRASGRGSRGVPRSR